MKRDAPTLSQLRLLVAVADSGGFSEAAANLDLSQSTVSHGVAALEEVLGSRLFRRERHGASLTSFGERVLVHARVALKAVEDIQVEAHGERESLHGVLRVSCIRSAGVHLLPHLLTALRQQVPGVQVDVTDDENAVLDGRADVGILNVRTSGGLLTWPLGYDEYVALIPTSFAVPARPEWSDLGRLPFIQGNPKQLCSTELREHLALHHVEVTPSYTAEEDSVVISMVSHGLGFAMLPRLAALPLPAGVRTANLPVPLSRRIVIAVDPRRASAPLVRRFVEVAQHAARHVLRPAGQAQ